MGEKLVGETGKRTEGEAVGEAPTPKLSLLLALGVNIDKVWPTLVVVVVGELHNEDAAECTNNSLSYSVVYMIVSSCGGKLARSQRMDKSGIGFRLLVGMWVLIAMLQYS